MEPKAYILIGTSVGKTQEITNRLRSLPGVQAVDRVTGPYDAIAVVEGLDLNAVRELVSGKIHRINGIVRAVTCMSLASY